MRALAIAALPHGVVEAERNRRMLRGLGATTRRPGAAALAVETRLNLFPPGSLATIDTVVDVGANEGRWSRGVLALTDPVRLIAIEPSPRVLPCLRSALAGHHNAVVLGAAVGETAGETTFNLTAHSLNASVLTPRTAEMDQIYGCGYEVVEQVTVPMTTLDDVTADLPDVSLLKIDVQGYEASVLAGAAKTLAKTRWVLIEANLRSHYRGDLLFPDLHALLVGLGFHLAGMSAPSVQGGVGMWADALYERSEARPSP